MKHVWIEDALRGDWDALRASLPVADRMAETPQDPVFHAEGDVWKHTRMVSEIAFRGVLARGDRDNLRGRSAILGAVLHDCAKPQTMTREFDEVLGRERIRNPGHASRGATLAWRLLTDAHVDLDTRYRVMTVIGWHHRPAHLMDSDPQEAMIRVLQLTASGTPWRELLDLCRADNLGRVCPDPEEAAAAFDLAEEIVTATGDALGLDLLNDAPDLGAEFRARIGRKTPELHLGEEPPYNGRLLIMSGIPGSGKSTWARGRASETGATVVSADEIRATMRGWERTPFWEGRVSQEFDLQIRSALAAGGEVIADATFLTSDIRNKFITLGHDYGLRVSVGFMDVPVSVAVQRNRDRKDPVPLKAMDRYATSVVPQSPLGIHDLFAIDMRGEVRIVTGHIDPHDEPSAEPGR